ncbi:hypothetical protein OG948_17540 [Embleya sp. NBC_00888]|uniref:hypothetical protein n=1 Tax=Embleya sp. NBC_00888 TaxID=2975960 RepID=UPI00387027E6|nr:hypothetical protein OG948_17540 [Embleya sp. NBC_00888]
MEKPADFHPTRVPVAVANQVIRLAVETGIDAYPQVSDVMARMAGGERWRVDDESALGTRLRTIAADAQASWRSSIDANGRDVIDQDERDAWRRRAGAAQALLATLHLPPLQAAETVLHQRLDPHWRQELMADLAEPPGGPLGEPGC